MIRSLRLKAQSNLFKTSIRRFDLPSDVKKNPLKVSEYYGENVFNFMESQILTKADKQEIKDVFQKKKELSKILAEKFAAAVLNWATSKGATHFIHLFQPMTEATAEKHDAFLSIEKGKPIEKFKASQLIQGEPDASSFPNGGARSTFQARGYTSWDFSSPIFLKSHTNGKTLCIPAAFVSYYGEALDIKTPLLRSITQLSKSVTEFLNLLEESDSKKHDKVNVSCGCEQEYFLIDKGLYLQRPDLMMTGRALFGQAPSKNQQLEDHYFGTVPERVLAYMQEVEVELYRLGIPAKTRHNEVAPGQFELAPIFDEANIAVDQNQIIMTILKDIADKHGFFCLLHERPFVGINGSGKHLNWSMGSAETGNLLEPTPTPHNNYRFLAIVAIICEAVYKRGGSLRTAVASHSNDHRLGANEAPPSIISVFLGDTLTEILEAYAAGKTYTEKKIKTLNLGTDQLAPLQKDNTDRNRTSPFAFTGNRFEFRAVGSIANVGVALTILNAAVTDVFNDVNLRIKKELETGKKVDDILIKIIKDLYNNCSKIVFNGDGYSKEWQDEAKKRGLPNMKTTPEALRLLTNSKANEFLTKLKIYSEAELKMRFNVRVERYCLYREIEFKTFISMIHRDILPVAIRYKGLLAQGIKHQKSVGIEAKIDLMLLKNIDTHILGLYEKVQSLQQGLVGLNHNIADADKIAQTLLPLSEEIANDIIYLEKNITDELWPLPTYFDLLFMR